MFVYLGLYTKRPTWPLQRLDIRCKESARSLQAKTGDHVKRWFPIAFLGVEMPRLQR